MNLKSMRRAAISLVSVGSVLLASVVVAQAPLFKPSPHVFKISAECKNRDPANELSISTGFRVKGQIGIITALHGVAGCNFITALGQTDSGIVTIQELTIAKVDIDRDVAWLVSPRLSSDEGLEAINQPQTDDYTTMSVIGYPYDLYRQKPVVNINIVQITELINLLPRKEIDAFNQRNSPSPQVKVLDVQGNIVPGHSGAPLLNASGKVMGVASGGQDLGRTEMVWAIPWEQIRWKTLPQELSARERTRLTNLAKTSSQFAFSAQTSYADFVQALAPDAGDAGTISSEPTHPSVKTVERFQEARAIAYSTGDVSRYYDMLKGEALAASIKLAGDIKAIRCQYFIEQPEAKYTHYVTSPTEAFVYTTRYEEQRRVCAGKKAVKLCLGYQIKYTVQKQGSAWFIIRRSSDYRPLVDCK